MGKRDKSTISVLMCCSDLDRVKGGMVSVVKNLLAFKGWQNCRMTYIPTHIESGKLRKAAYFALAYIRVFLRLMLTRVDLVHLHVSERGSVYRKAVLLYLAKRFGKPVILHHHGADFDLFFRALSQKDRAFVVRFLESADINVVLSEQIRREFQERAPLARLSVLYNAVPVPQENRYHSDRSLILTLGRLGERKGTYDLLRAIEALDGELPERFKVCLCGDGETQQVKQWVQDHGLAHRIAHIGWTAGEEKNMLLDRTLCHVLVSYREGLPMAILETMAQGIPNISTRIASIPEVIDSGEQGILIEPGDVEALKAALSAICSDRQMCERMSAASYQLIRGRFSMAACAKWLEEIYHDILESDDKKKERQENDAACGIGD